MASPTWRLYYGDAWQQTRATSDLTETSNMSDTLLTVLGALCLLAGLAGCLLPVLPGPPLAYVGLLLLHLTDRVDVPRTHLLAGLVLVAIVWALDLIIPAIGARMAYNASYSSARMKMPF